MRLRAGLDPKRGAQVVARTPLLYTRGADVGLDRPTHVRAGSALVAFDDGRLAVIQDDTCFLAVIDPATRAVHDVAFPVPTGGGVMRQFDDARGNKRLKLDLEAAFLTRQASGGLLLACLGSGSSTLRERIVLVESPETDAPSVTIVEAPELYASLRAERMFSGSELNVEGAAVHKGDLVLFQRGNGAPSSTHGPVDATARIGLRALVAYLRGEAASPPLRDVIAWDLGSADGHRLTFTDGSITPQGQLAFLACAEDSPDATRDGPVSAVAIGCLDLAARTSELGLILDERGAPLLDKAEGLAFDPVDPTRAFVVTDRDDPDAPSELLEIRLAEAWSR